ncbi:aminotransferase DegT [Adhaeribacter aerolatus]|uniref:Aminotransferase DegT n=1 Tax=Adhaeribacter aerolatus TaxID=670289 RepID=A0A512B4H4_9BACT|nr:DegT/DnrJ/EryC1/StrS family aminotransferase [Adhaeribacter aerolatus]GEO06868.1 aminotransferase DegT [Adhaeribacter aerolatus]
MDSVIPVNEPLLDGNEKQYLINCIETGWISSEGPYVNQFEALFATKVNRKFGIAVCNGTVALETAVLALGIGKDDEVIMPAFTIISCAAAIVRAGAKPVLVDADPVTWNMDVNQVAANITPRTKAIMVVHIYGLPVDMAPLLAIAAQHGLKIIEDAAEMHGQTYNQKPCGSFGDISIFSFYPNKHITTGEGGMIVTDNPELAAKCRSLRNLCFIPEKRFYHEELGYNFRMTNLQAALGLAQLERLDHFIQIKRAMGQKYHRLLHQVPGLQLPLPTTPFANNIYWVFGIVLTEEIPFNALVAMQKLGALKVQTRPFFYPMHLQPVFHKMSLFQGEHYPVAEKLAERGFYLPSGMALTEEQIHQVAERLQAILV